VAAQSSLARVYSVFILSCMWVGALRRADPSSKESYQLCTELRNLIGGKGPTKGRGTIDEWMKSTCWSDVF
jgi:hypothetical protein